MFTIYKKTIDWGGRPLTIETGRLARQADGAALVTYGDSVVLATVCFAREASPGIDFFPLTVTYQERFYAAGRIPGGFFKREGRPSEKEVLTSRLIDRPVRPLFPEGFRNETHVVCTTLSSDGENNPDIAAMVAASAALRFSGIPFMGPIAAARVGYIDGAFVLNPTTTELKTSALDLVIAGTREGVLMVESEAQELSEDVMLEAVYFGHEQSKKVLDAIEEVASAAAKPGFAVAPLADHTALKADMAKAFSDDVLQAYSIKAKQDRQARLKEIKAEAVTQFGGAEGENASVVKELFADLEYTTLRTGVLSTKKRIDGRGLTDVRPIVCEVDVLPRAHGSALFTRGETQAMVVVTMGTGRDEQIIDAIEGEYKDSFMFHYNFPPFSVGEARRMGPPGRREIGHGRLARRAVEMMVPKKDVFPYTLRVVSEILESNGSSSMASVCGASMALMAAGVPVSRPVAGIAMGLVKEDKDFVVLSDIMGDEDHLGDMDFKVAGTTEGITALQMDIKITSITRDIMDLALNQANAGRLHILGKMAKAITAHRTEISDFAPAMESFAIDKEKIREVIGSGGKVIRGLSEEYGCAIDITDEGVVSVASSNRSKLKQCVQTIKDIVATAEIGKEYDGEVVRVVDFGAFIKFMPNQEGLVHISEMVPVRLQEVADIVNDGDSVRVKVVNIEMGKVRLTMKDVTQPEAIALRQAASIERNGARPEGAAPIVREERPRRDDRDRRPRRRD